VGDFPPKGNALHVTVERIYAYTAEEIGGVQVINVDDQEKPKEASVIEDYEDARAVLWFDDYVYVANGEQGIGAIKVEEPADPEVIPSLKTPGTAIGLAAAEYHLFVADGSGGIQAAYMLIPAKSQLVGSLELPGGSVAIDVLPQKEKENEPGHFYVYSAGTDPGLQILNATKTAKFIDIGFYGSPDTVGINLFQLFIFFSSLILWVFLSIQLVFPVESRAERWTASIRVFQYILGQLGAGILIREGKSVSAANQSSSKNESNKLGQGIVMVDPSSAVILAKTPIPYRVPIKLLVRFLSKIDPTLSENDGSPDLRVVSPGVHFTQHRGFPFNPKKTEKVLQIADLRQQIRIRPQVNGFTRDGIEVGTSVYSIFSIGVRPEVMQVTYVDGQTPENLRLIYHDDHEIKDLTDEIDAEDQKEIDRFIQDELEKGNLPPNEQDASDHILPDLSPYDYDRDRVFAALFSQAHDVNDDSHMDWTELPVHVAVEVFRNLLMKEIYDNLYYPSKREGFPLTIFKQNFVRGLKNLGVLSYQVVLHKSRNLKPGDLWDKLKENEELIFYPVKKLQNPKVLRKRGITVIHAGFSELAPVSKVVQERRYDYWSSQWEREAIEIEARYNFEATRIRNLGRSKAQSEMVIHLSKIFKDEDLENEAMALRIFQALESAAADPYTRALLPDDALDVLFQLKRWFFPPGDSAEPDTLRIKG
jgi:hypothetical protein